MIQVTPELLKSEANKLRTLRGQHDDTMTRIKQLVDGLVDNFKGAAQTAYVEKFYSMQPTFKQFSENLEAFAKQLDLAANSFDETDNDIANIFRNG